jgi:hypothetical protein
MAQPANDAPGQGGFPGAEIAFQEDQARAFCDLGNTAAERDHGIFIGQEKDYFRHGDCSSSN